MLLIPAVDIRGGQTVRLEQGDFAREKVYDRGPVEAARRWMDGGATHLHIVDLDGARAGRPENLDVVSRIATFANEGGVQVQYGGGLRALKDIDAAIEAGVDRVVLGSVAFSTEGVLEDALKEHGSRVIVSIDARDGYVHTHGWGSTDRYPTEEAFKEMSGKGVRRFVFTSIGRDGTLAGPDLGEIERVSAAIEGTFTYAGGIGSLGHLAQLFDLGIGALEGVIVGKALYEERFTVAEGQAALEGGEE